MRISDWSSDVCSSDLADRILLIRIHRQDHDFSNDCRDWVYLDGVASFDVENVAISDFQKEIGSLCADFLAGLDRVPAYAAGSDFSGRRQRNTGRFFLEARAVGVRSFIVNKSAACRSMTTTIEPTHRHKGRPTNNSTTNP